MLDKNKTIIQQYKNKKARNAGPPVIPALGNQSQRFSEFEANLVYSTTFRTARATPTNFVFKNKQTKNINSRLPNHLSTK